MDGTDDGSGAGPLDRLVAELSAVTPEEFRLTEARYETDARLGRELLFLLSNAEWCRRTTEVIDISRVSSVETKVIVDVDTGYVHEALRTTAGTVWLPLFTLPSDTMRPAGPKDGPVEQLGGAARRLGLRGLGPRRLGLRRLGLRRLGLRRLRRDDVPAPDRRADPPIGVEITDAQGVRVAGVPQVEIRRQLAAALAEAILARLNRTRPAGSRPESFDRDHEVVLAAALAPLLAGDPPAATPTDGEGGEGDRDDRRTQLGLARDELRGELAAVATSREAEIVAALRGSTFVVVPAAFGPPTSYTVLTPTRALVEPPRASASAVSLRVAVLAPTTHADRVLEVVLPDGVRVHDDGGPARPSVVVDVAALPQFAQLAALVRRIVATTGWPRKQLAELAGTKLESAVQAMRHHYDSVAAPSADAPPGREVRTTPAVEAALASLRLPLRQLASPGGEHTAQHWADELRGRWAAAEPTLTGRAPTPPGGPEPPPAGGLRLRRRITGSSTNPGSVRFRASAIEEFTLRAQPTTAEVRLTVESPESPVLGTARAVNMVNLVVLLGVAALLWLLQLDADNDSRAEVLAALLTFFPAIQASRLRQPDSTRLAGLLTMRHFSAGLATALPGLLLAGVLAFEPAGLVPKVAAAAAVVAQLGCAWWIRLLRRGIPTSAPRRAHRLTRGPVLDLHTDRSPDHQRFDVLRSPWCRSLTSDILLAGQSSYPYIVVDDAQPDSFARLLSGSQGRLAEGPVRGRGPDLFKKAYEVLLSRVEPDGTAGGPPNLVGILRGLSVDRAVTFLIFRDPPQPGWEDTDGGRRSVSPLDLDRDRFAPIEPPDWVLDVMVGFPSAPAPGPVADHPLSTLAAAAAAAEFTLLNVQLPAPPLQGRTPRQWLRARVGVPLLRDDPLDRLAEFLDALDGMTRRGIRVHLREVPPMETLDATQAAAEDTFDRPPAPPEEEGAADGARPAGRGSDDGELLTDDQLLVPIGVGARWRLVAVCARPQSGLLSDVLAALAKEGRISSVAAAISGVLNGASVVILLGRTEEDADHETVTARLNRVPTLRSRGAEVRVLPGVRGESGPRPVPHALLRVEIHTADRPGVMQDFLQLLGDRIAAEVRPRPQPERTGDRAAANGAEPRFPKVDVVYTLTPVVDGRAISARMLIRLPAHPAGPTGWEGVRWPEEGRRMARGVTRAGVAAPAGSDRLGRRPDDTVVTLRLVRRPPPLPAPDAGGAGSPGREPAPHDPPRRTSAPPRRG